MKRTLFAALMLVTSSCLLFASSPIKEGHMISGHVIEKETEENIPYATVLIIGTSQGTVSNEVGQFQFRNLAEGTYKLRVSAVGYKTLEKEVVVHKDYTAVVHSPYRKRI